MSNANPKPSFKRWYERQPQLAQSVKLLIMLPDEVTTILSEALIALANKEFKDRERESAFRSVGSEKIMGVHKSKNRRREYDVNEMLHKAMNYLYVLSDEGQDNMATHVLSMVTFIHQYFSTCLEFKMNSKPEEVAAITHRYVSDGSPAVDSFLNRLREEFHLKAVSAEKAVQAQVDILEALEAHATGATETNKPINPNISTANNGEIIVPSRLRSKGTGKNDGQAKEKDQGIKNAEVQARAKVITHKNAEIKAQVKANSNKGSDVKSRTKDNNNKNAEIKARLKANLSNNMEVQARSKTNDEEQTEASLSKSETSDEALDINANNGLSTDDRLDLSAKDDKQGMKLSKLEIT